MPIGMSALLAAPVLLAAAALPPSCRFLAVSAGGGHSLAIAEDGSVWAWGEETYGQLGNGPAAGHPDSAVGVPAPVQGLPLPARSIAAGRAHSLAALVDGSVWVWGSNSHGQLGLRRALVYLSGEPLRLGSLQRIIQVAASEDFSLVLDDQGQVWSMGDNSSGQLGLGLTASMNEIPLRITALSGVRSIAAGVSHALAVLGDGTLKAWGSNGDGELGNGAIVPRELAPVSVEQPPGYFIAAAAGLGFSLGLLTDGTVWAWGANDRGQLARDPSTAYLTVPAQVSSLAGISSIAAGGQTAHAVDGAGTARAWGENGSGQAGIGVESLYSSPRALAPGAPVARIEGGAAHSLALLQDGSVLAWGSNVSGQLGIDHLPWPDRIERIALSGTIRSLALGPLTALAVDHAGGVTGWGQSRSGEAAGGRATLAGMPRVSPLLSRVASAAVGNGHALALLDDFTVVAWGRNEAGQLGDGATTDSLVPVPVAGLPATIVQVAAGEAHSHALAADGSIWSWGSNQQGELGTGSAAPFESVPARVALPVPAASVSSGPAGRWSVARARDGRVFAWGMGNGGQLGRSALGGSPTPVKLDLPLDVVTVVAGGSHGLALRAGGELLGWGSNFRGQANGLASPAILFSPVAVEGPQGVTAIAAGFETSFALDEQGTLWGLGDNRYHQLLLPWSERSYQPTPIARIPSGSTLQAGWVAAAALTPRGEVLSWGGNQAGALGRDAPDRSSEPLPVAFDVPRRDLGPVLRATRDGGDVLLDLGSAEGWVWRLCRDPDKTALGVTTLVSELLVPVHRDLAAIGGPGLACYVVRGLSSCTLLPGP